MHVHVFSNAVLQLTNDLLSFRKRSSEQPILRALYMAILEQDRGVRGELILSLFLGGWQIIPCHLFKNASLVLENHPTEILIFFSLTLRRKCEKELLMN